METRFRDEEQEYLKVVAYTLLRYGKWDKAWAIYEALELLMPEDIQVIKGLVVSGFHSGRLAQALALVDRWLEIASDEKDLESARVMRARILWALGRHDEATDEA
ncbi:MAG: hypothetical protein ACP5TY_00400 [Thermodesulforhabdaceae bacterium]